MLEEYQSSILGRSLAPFSQKSIDVLSEIGREIAVAFLKSRSAIYQKMAGQFL